MPIIINIMKEHKRFMFRPGEMKTSLLLLWVITPGLIFPLFAFSQTGSEGAVFAPFVSQLSAETRNNLVRLSWQDSRDARGPVYIFRSTRPFRGDQLPGDIKPVEVPYGAQSYVDENEGAGTIYYFAAASDEQGRRYDILIPYNNTIPVNTAAPSGETLRVAEAPAPAEPEQSPGGPGISGLEARVEGEGITLSYRTAGEDKNTVLYRGVQPLRTTADLLQAVIIQSGPARSFTDYPVPGIPYYYAVIFEDELIQGDVKIFPGRNATVQGVEIPAGASRIGQPGAQERLRSMPLPMISIYNAVPGSDSYSEIPGYTPLKPEAAKAVGDIQRVTPNPPPLRKPRAFSRDLEAPAGGEESQLRTIVQGPFVQQDWQTCRTELLRYLSLPRSSLSEARARFYLGQVYYFSGSNREALVEFLMVQSHYPLEAKEWLSAVLDRIAQ
jgi:hypothetical protein